MRHSYFATTEIRREGEEAWQIWRRAQAQAIIKQRVPMVTIDGAKGEGRLVLLHEQDLPFLVEEAAR
jgi:hypothetical protein